MSRAWKILLALLAADILAFCIWKSVENRLSMLPFDKAPAEPGEYETVYLNNPGTLEVYDRGDGQVVSWRAEDCSSSLLQQIPAALEKRYTLLNEIPIMQYWEDSGCYVVFSHAVKDTGLCDYLLVRYPKTVSLDPDEYFIDYAVAIDAE